MKKPKAQSDCAHGRYERAQSRPFGYDGCDMFLRPGRARFRVEKGMIIYGDFTDPDGLFGPLGLTRDRVWRGGARRRTRTSRAASERTAEMMPADETRGPVFWADQCKGMWRGPVSGKPLRGHGIRVRPDTQEEEIRI